MARRLSFVVARVTVVSFALLTALYCLLAYVPFTYHQIHVGGLLPWASVFARLHPWLYWPAFAAAVCTLPSLRNDRTRALTVLFFVVHAALGLKLAIHPVLSHLENDSYSLGLAVVALVPLVWIAVLDWLACGQLVWGERDHGEVHRCFRSCLLTGTCVWLWSVMLFMVRVGVLAQHGLVPAQWAAALAFSLAAHVTVALAAFLVLVLVAAIADLAGGRAAAHVVALAVAFATILALIFRFVVFAPLPLPAAASALLSIGFAVALVAYATGTSARLSLDQPPFHSPLMLFLAPLRPLGFVPPFARVGGLLLTFAVGSIALLHASGTDWGYLLRTLIVLGVWAAAFAVIYVCIPAPAAGRAGSLIIVAGVVVCAFMGMNSFVPALRANANAAPQLASVLDEYADYDVAFRVARGILSPRQPAVADGSLYQFLAANTNIARSVRTDPVDVQLASLEPPAVTKPHIFLFVIDSLRRDYLSPYNPAVNFTPAIGAFAAESVVFRSAFTRYAGTGLSEPSIWSGAMLLHKQYVTPFYPMNSLQKLLDAEQYRQFITKDEILSTILAPSPAITELDEGQPTMNCELCRTLSELKKKISNEKPGAAMFAYTQPQDIHVSVINRTGRSVVDNQPYPGFDAPYASRIRNLDRCFGEFIQFLKDKGLYDNSVVVLTADHGDSLGERGQWGHAYNVVPEVVRVPLLVHLPAAMQQLYRDDNAPASLVDITPSLYYLLGHKPAARIAIFGHSLFTATATEAELYHRDSYLVVSSYAPVYGVVGDNGRSLYVVDGLAYKDSSYHWQGDSVGPRAVTPEIRATSQDFIRQQVGSIAQYYRFDRAAPVPK